MNTLIADPPPGAPVPPILPPRDGFLALNHAKFAESFAGDLPSSEAAFMADSQVPWGLGALEGQVSDPAWRSKPSWYLVATDDRMIPPPAQRAMAERAGFDRRRSCREPLRLRVPAGGCRRAHRASGYHLTEPERRVQPTPTLPPRVGVGPKFPSDAKRPARIGAGRMRVGGGSRTDGGGLEP